MKAKPIFVLALAALLLTAGAFVYASTTTQPQTVGGQAEHQELEEETMLPVEDRDVSENSISRLATEVKILKAMDELGLSKEQVESLTKLARRLDKEIADGTGIIAEQLEIEKEALLTGSAEDAIREAENQIVKGKADISKALSAAQKEAEELLLPEQRSKALEMVKGIQIPKDMRERALSLGPKMLKALSDLLEQKLERM